VLIKRTVLDGIVEGRIDLAFRRQRRPTVKTGGTLRTVVGQLAIGRVDAVSERRISAEDARRAGYASRAELLRELSKRAEGRIYRVELSLAGPDPRVGLRESAELSDADVAEIDRRLTRLDAASTHGVWTMETLQLIAAHPATLSTDIAAMVGRERKPFKTDVRKLKELGLTESLEVGYRLSPRGIAYLARTGR
jgi:predicted transcriptional regulator